MLYSLAVIGILASAYMLYIKGKLKSNPQYKSICDINNRVSCTKVATTSYGKTFGIENGILGLFFYLGIISATVINFVLGLKILAIAGLVMTIYLLHKLYTLKMICPVCLVVHGVNILLFGWVFFW